jgi:hypothetical protein
MAFIRARDPVATSCERDRAMRATVSAGNDEEGARIALISTFGK